jgi:hypothetical protein
VWIKGEKMNYNYFQYLFPEFESIWSKSLPKGIELSTPKIPQIKEVIYNPPATIVYWKDGTKTVVKTDGVFDEETGLAMAYMRKIYPSRSAYKKVIKNATRPVKK